MARRGGFALLTMLFLLLVFAVLGAGFVTLIFSESRLAIEEYRYNQAFYIAEAGKNFGLKYLAGYGNWSANMNLPYSQAFNNGVFTISSTNEEPNQIDLISRGVITFEGKAYSRALRATVSIERGTGLTHQFDYIIYGAQPSGGSRLNIQGNARVYGDFYYNGPIRVKDSARQEGGTVYSTTIEVQGSGYYESWQASTAEALPIWDNTSYEAILAATDNDNSTSLNLGWGQTLDLNGGTHYYKDIRLGWGSRVIGPGALVSTGGHNIDVEYGVGIGSDVRFISDHDFTYKGGSNLINSIEVYAKHHLIVKDDLTVPAGSLLYSIHDGEDAIKIAGTVAAANLLAPYGQVHMEYGLIRGLIYCNEFKAPDSGEIHGAIVCNDASTIQGSVAMYYDTNYLPDFLLGLGGGGNITAEAGLEVSDWQEAY